jgi:NAD(P)-dependent dehydrogenase (short-subunit alcohol dehydrogenase family)
VQQENRKLAGQVAAITGALGDIGSATAIELARRGADVALSDVRPAADAAALLDALRGANVRASYHPVDVGDADAVEAWIAAVAGAWATPSLIIANAATVTVVGIRTLTAQQWSRELRVNLDGAFHLTASATRRLLAETRPGRVVFVGSWAAHVPHVHIPAYCVAKAGMRMLCKCMALELAPHDILVNEVAPGFVDAGLSAQVWAQVPGRRAESQAHVPTHQLIRPEEVAVQIAYLCDPDNRHMTGTTLLMDGGLSLVGPRARSS